MIDAYCHCGTSKYLPVEDVSRMMQALEIERAVLVQHHGEFDNTYLADVVRSDPRRYGAVALLDPEDLSWPRRLADTTESGCFKGIRLPHETVLRRPEFCFAAADLGYVLMIDAQRGLGELMTALETLLARSIGTVISHLGYPRIEGGKLVAGRELLSLAGIEDVYVLLSGSGMWPSDASGALDEFTAEVVDTFGADRLLWGSNYPVCGGVVGVRGEMERITCDRWGLTQHELDAVIHGNAARLWFADPGLA